MEEKEKDLHPLPNYSKGEEIFNAVTHIVGGGFGIVILVLCIIFSAIYQDGIGVLASVIYGVSMIILYTMSSIYHFLSPKLKAKKVFRVFDHCTIYLLIAGTYTPICMIGMRGSQTGLILLLIVWLCAIIGITFTAINMYHPVIKYGSMILYLIMGWCVIFDIKGFLDCIPWQGLMWLLIGGISYTLGVILYALGKKKKWMHSIWHLFVLVGTLTQFVTILFYVIIQ